MNYPLLQLDNQICFALHAASRAMTASYRPMLNELGLTYPQYVTMLALWESDGVSVGELGERLLLDSGTLTPLLKRLERAELIERTRRASDERTVEITLTAAGRLLRNKAESIPERILCNIGLPLADVFRLREELKALTAQLNIQGVKS